MWNRYLCTYHRFNYILDLKKFWPKIENRWSITSCPNGCFVSKWHWILCFQEHFSPPHCFCQILIKEQTQRTPLLDFSWVSWMLEINRISNVCLENCLKHLPCDLSLIWKETTDLLNHHVMSYSSYLWKSQVWHIDCGFIHFLPSYF